MNRLAPRHTVVVRITHWINAVSFLALAVSGIAILLAYPRFHWGDSGSLGVPALFDLPLPFVLELGIRGPGRSLHFLAGWVCLVNGLLYVISGFYMKHFSNNLLPKRSDFAFRSVLSRRSADQGLQTYNALQRTSYLAVVFGLFPVMFVTGLAMSPALTSAFPVLVNVFGGHQSARTLHFFAANLLVLFLVVHIAMLIAGGFVKRCRAMITGYHTSRRTSHDH
jgi:thiosulfate reductase cytochrome b subunit